MVKVKQSFNFSHQEIIPISGKITALTFISRNYLAIAPSGSHSIEIYNLIEKSKNEADFELPIRKIIVPVIGDIIEMIYCTSGGYLMTLEKDSSSNKIVRILTNFNNFKNETSESLLSYTITPRIAAKITPLSMTNVFDVIELPTDNPQFIACCQSSSKIGICSKSRLHLYRYKECVHDTHKFIYIDFIPMTFSVYMSFIPTKLIISENVFSICNNIYCAVFKIIGLSCKSESTSVLSSSFDTDSLEITGNETIEKSENIAKTTNIKNCLDFEEIVQNKNYLVDLNHRKITPRMELDDTIKHVGKPVKVNSIKIRILNDNKTTTNGEQYDIQCLIQLCMPFLKEERFSFVCMDLKAVYAINTSDHNDRRTDEVFVSKNYENCIGHSFLICSNYHGYFYQLSSQKNWINDNEKCLITYNFTAPVLNVKINDFVIQAITTDSVETYTNRIAHKIFSSRYEYPELFKMYPEECCPDNNSTPLLIGLCSFLNIYRANIDEDKLVLITDNKALLPQNSQNQSTKFPVKFFMNLSLNSSVSNDPSSLTMYCLKFPHIIHFIDDLETIAQNFLDYNGSTENFISILEEANCILRLTQIIKVNHISDDTRELLRNKLMKNSKKLAQITLCSKLKVFNSQSYGFFKMCNTTPNEIYDFFIENIYNEDDHESTLAFINTLKKFITDFDITKTNQYLSCKIKSPKFSHHLDSNLAVELFFMFKKYIPDQLPELLLKSNIFIDCITSDLLDYLSHEANKSTIVKVLFAVVYYRKRANKKDAAIHIINELNKEEVCEVFKNFPNQIFDGNDYSVLSDFTEENFIENEQNTEGIEGFIDTLITYVCIQQTVSVDNILHIFINYLSTHIGLKGYKTAQHILSHVLQIYLYSYFNRNTLIGIKKDFSDESSYEIGAQSYQICSMEYDNIAYNLISSSSINTYKPEINSFEYTSALKVLFRIYLGQLKQMSDKETIAPISRSLGELLQFILSNPSQIINQKKKHKFEKSDLNGFNKISLPILSTPGGKVRRPIPCLDDRPSYLNRMPPFDIDKDFIKVNNEEFPTVSYDFASWDNTLIVLLLKIQSFLASQFTGFIIVEDFIEFISSNYNIIGLESLLTLIVPPVVALNYLIDNYPSLVMLYSNVTKIHEHDWELFLKNLFQKKDKIENWQFHLNEILKNLAQQKSYENLIACFPKNLFKTDKMQNDRIVMDIVDENNPFQVIIRDAVAKKRSVAIKQMIENTGKQLLGHQT